MIMEKKLFQHFSTSARHYLNYSIKKKIQIKKYFSNKKMIEK